MNASPFPEWFHQQAIIQNHAQHILDPEAGLPHNKARTLKAAQFYDEFANQPGTNVSTALIAAIGYAITGEDIRALEVVLNHRTLQRSNDYCLTAAIATIVPEMTQEAEAILQDSPKWLRCLKATQSPMRTVDEIHRMWQDAAIKDDTPHLYTTVRWAMATLTQRRARKNSEKD